MLSDTRQYHVPLLLAFSVVTRIGAFFHIDTVTLGWRQSDLSSIAMNYLANGGRHGWYLALAWVTPETINNLRVKGAGYLVLYDADIDSLRSNSALYSHLTSMYSSIIDPSDLLVFRLAEK
jgi:hypothetical protein